MGRNLCSWFFLLMPDRLSRLKPSACSPFRPPTWMLGSHICWHHSCLARCVGRRMLASRLPCQVCRQGYVGISVPLPGASAGVYWHHGCLARCVSRHVLASRLPCQLCQHAGNWIGSRGSRVWPNIPTWEVRDTRQLNPLPQSCPMTVSLNSMNRE